MEFAVVFTSGGCEYAIHLPETDIGFELAQRALLALGHRPGSIALVADKYPRFYLFHVRVVLPYHIARDLVGFQDKTTAVVKVSPKSLNRYVTFKPDVAWDYSQGAVEAVHWAPHVNRVLLVHDWKMAGYPDEFDPAFDRLET